MKARAFGWGGSRTSYNRLPDLAGLVVLAWMGRCGGLAALTKFHPAAPPSAWRCCLVSREWGGVVLARVEQVGASSSVG